MSNPPRRDETIVAAPISEPEPTISPLHAAMRMADLVRSSLNQKAAGAPAPSSADEGDFRMTPGILEGAAAGALTLLVLTPVRSLLLRAAGNRLGVFPDLVLTTSQIMISGNAALFYGSLYGSYHYLQTFTQIPPTAVSPTVDKICHQSLTRFDDFYKQAAAQKSKSIPSWNPNVIVLREFTKAIELCQERSAKQVEMQDTTLNKDQMTWWKRG